MFSLIGFFTIHSALVLFFLALVVCGCIMVSAVPPSYLVATVAGEDGGMATSASIYYPSGIWQNSVDTIFLPH
jgi:hypothetical protein